MTEIILTNYCQIKTNFLKLDGEILIEEKSKSIDNFFNDLYIKLEIDYPKFYKMDNQSKLGLLACEYLLKANNILLKYKSEEIGIVLSNNDASTETDQHYLNTLKSDSYFPSPTLFVYTLPNVVSGEICIRNKIKGENAFFISNSFDAEQMHFYIKNLILHTDTEACIGGWINFLGENYEVFIFSIEINQQNGKPFTPELLNQIYKK